MQIIRASDTGEGNPKAMTAFRDIRHPSSPEVIRAALGGNDQDGCIFAAPRSLGSCEVCQFGIGVCVRKPEAATVAGIVWADGDLATLSRAWIKRRQGKRCVSPVVSVWGDFGHFGLQLSLQEFCGGAPK